MRRDAICSRCGSVNKPPAENCVHCGLEIWWGLRVPWLLRFWSWSPAAKWRIGPLAAALAFGAVKVFSLELIGAVLLTGSIVALLWTLAPIKPGKSGGGQLSE